MIYAVVTSLQKKSYFLSGSMVASRQLGVHFENTARLNIVGARGEAVLSLRKKEMISAVELPLAVRGGFAGP